MSGRNAPCPCGSKKKFKRCCMLLSQSLKSEEHYFMGASDLKSFISAEAHSIFDEIQTIIEQKESSLELGSFEFEESLIAIMHVWNTSKMSAGYRKSLVDMIDHSQFKKVLNDGSNTYKKLSHFNEMIVGFEVHDFKNNGFDFTLETKKIDKDWILDHKEVAANDINNCWGVLSKKK